MPTGHAKPAMANGSAFLIHEIRRHAPTLVLAFLVFAAIPVVSRLVEGEWRFWDGARNALATALAIYVLAPFLTLMMAATGWARERSLNLLDSLYARPLPSATVFVYRALAIAVAISVWTALVFAFGRARWVELAQVLGNLPGLPGPVSLLIVGTGLALGAGLLTSALAPSMEWAVRWSTVLVTAVWLVALGLPKAVGTAVVLRWTEFSAVFLAEVMTGFVATTALIFLAFAWRVMSLAPDGPGRLRSVAPIGTAAALTAVIVTAAVLHVPRLAGPESRLPLWMGEDSSLSFAPVRLLRWRETSIPFSLSHPIVRSSQGITVLRDVYALRYGGTEFDGPWIEPSRGLAMLPAVLHDRGDWVLLDRDGNTTAIPLPSFGDMPAAIGWAPEGARFAWKWYPIDNPSGAIPRIIVFEPGGTTREIDVGVVTPHLLQGAWMDSRTLLLYSAGDSRGNAWWTTLDVESGALGPRHELNGSRLAAPALVEWGGYANLSRLPLLDGVPVVLLVGPEHTNLWGRPAGDPARITLARPDPASGTLYPGPELPENSLWTSLGSLDDGSLVWTVPERAPRLPQWDGGASTQVYRLDAIDGEPEALCSMPTGSLFGFVGESGSWLVWDTTRLFATHAGRAHEYQLWGCNRETKEARRLSEWTELVHPFATITDRGLFTASGWVPLGG